MVTQARRELVVAHGVVWALRDLLVQLMLAEQGIRKTDGQKRLNPYLSREQQLVLESLPSPEVEAVAITKACLSITREFVTRAKRLAITTSLEFPTEVLQATERHLQEYLGDAWTL